MILIVVQAILPLVPLYLMKLLLDSFTQETPPDTQHVVFILAGFGLTQVLLIIASNMATYISQMQSDIVSDHMSDLVATKAIDIDLEYFDTDRYHDIFERALAQSSGRPIMVLNSLAQLIQSGVSLSAIFLLLASLHWAVSLVLLFIAIPIALIRLYYTNKLVHLNVSQTQKQRLSRYYFKVLTHSDDAKEVRVFGYGADLKAKFLKLKEVLRHEKKSISIKQNTSIGLAQTVEAVAIVVALAFIALRALKGLISVGDIAMYFGAFQKGQTSINNALRSFISLHENRQYMEHLFQFLDLEKKIVDPIAPSPVPVSIDTLSVKNVFFSYPNTSKDVLTDISFSAKRGQLIAIVGENGSGKSSLVKLINRLYEPSNGAILINDVDINSLNQDDYRRKLTVIFQNYSKYNGSVSENIQYADVHQDPNQLKIEHSSQLGHAAAFIDDLPQRYDTHLGRSFRHGEELSGGQWQKLALARAFYKDADIIILDEPTSFIDPIAEDEIFGNLRALAKNKIMILITHRIYNLRQADHILVLDKGRIVEQGSHTNLMEKSGLYKEMFERQE